MNDTQISKLMSLLLRHAPEKAGLRLDPQGWIAVDDLVAGMNRAGRALSRADVERIVAANDKQRFALSPDGARIRVSQGHSVEVNLAYRPVEPPEVLFHGTATRFVESIMASGLERRSRHHVHLSADRATAVAVGSRHGKSVVLEVAATRMKADGHQFFQSANGVWLTERVPPEYLSPAAEREQSSV